MSGGVAWRGPPAGRGNPTAQRLLLHQPTDRNDVYHGWHLFIIRVKNPQNRQQLHDFLIKKGIGANFHYPAVYSHPYYRQAGYGKTSLPNEEVYQSTCVTLPCYPSLTHSEVKFVSSVIKEFFRT